MHTFFLDCLIFLGAYLLSLVAALVWLHHLPGHRRAQARRTTRSGVAGRMMLFYALFLALVVLLDLNAWVALAAFYGAALLLVTVPILRIGPGIVPVAALILGFEWIMGWPHRDEFEAPAPPQPDEGVQQHAPELIGRCARAIHPLNPSGQIEIQGRRFDAVSRSGYIDAGSAVRVVNGQGYQLVVERALDTPSTANRCGKTQQTASRKGSRCED